MVKILANCMKIGIPIGGFLETAAVINAIEEWFRTKVDNKCIQFNHWTTHGWLEFKELCG